MTSRELVYAALSHQPIDRKPIIIWPHDEMYSDVAIVPAARINGSANGPRVLLAEVLSPFSRATAAGADLMDLLQNCPKDGERLLQTLAGQTRSEIESALARQVDGIFYRLQGAEPESTTPMEYGGHFLELDRALLESAGSARTNVLFVEGGMDLYIDFVSDLPAQIFAWDIDRTGIGVDSVRKLRSGALAAADAEADFLFGSSYGHLKQLSAEGAGSRA